MIITYEWYIVENNYCMFVIKQSSVLHSQPKSTVGTPAYVAPEVLSRKKYNGKVCELNY